MSTPFAPFTYSFGQVEFEDVSVALGAYYLLIELSLSIFCLITKEASGGSRGWGGGHLSPPPPADSSPSYNAVLLRCTLDCLTDTHTPVSCKILGAVSRSDGPSDRATDILLWTDSMRQINGPLSGPSLLVKHPPYCEDPPLSGG